MRWHTTIVALLLLSYQANAAASQRVPLPLELSVTMPVEAKAALYVYEADYCLFLSGLLEISNITTPDRAVSNTITVCKEYLDRMMLGSYGGDHLLLPVVKSFRDIYTQDFNRLKENVDAMLRKERKK
jgi:hypothetical protein